MAMEIVSCASLLIEPSDMAAEQKRVTIFSTGSTSSIGTGVASLKRKRLRSVTRERERSLMMALYCLKVA